MTTSRTLLAVALAAGCSSAAPPPAVTPAAPPPAGGAPAVTRLRVSSAKIPLDDPALGMPLGLPARGTADLAIELRVPAANSADDLRGATGEIRLACVGACVIGDDHARIVPHSDDPRTRALIGDGMEFGHLTIDAAAVRVTVTDGRAEIASWTWTSPDVQVTVAGHAELGASIADSVIDACVRFRPSDTLARRDGKTYAVLSTTGAAVAPDGQYNIHLTGTIGDLKRRAEVCDGSPPGAPPGPAATDAPVATLDDATGARIDHWIHPIDATTYELDHALASEITGNTEALLRGARMVPSVRNGKPDGFKLYAIRPSSLYAKLGFQNGDTVESIAGHALDSADATTAAYAAVLALVATPGQTIAVLGIRRGQPLKLTYRVL